MATNRTIDPPPMGERKKAAPASKGVKKKRKKQHDLRGSAFVELAKEIEKGRDMVYSSGGAIDLITRSLRKVGASQSAKR